MFIILRLCIGITFQVYLYTAFYKYTQIFRYLAISSRYIASFESLRLGGLTFKENILFPGKAGSPRYSKYVYILNIWIYLTCIDII